MVKKLFQKQAYNRFFLVLVMIIITLFSIDFSIAGPPSTTIINSYGITISYPNPSYIRYGDELYVRFWAYNITNGALFTNASINCSYNLLDASGKNILRVSSSDSLKFDRLGPNACQNCFNINVSGSNFTTTGYYPYQIRCYDNANTIGGFLSDIYLVSPTGQEFTVPEAILYSLCFLVLLGIFAFSFIYSIKIPWANVSNEDGEVISVNDWKYVKLFLICMTYVEAVLIFAFLMGVTSNYIPYLGISKTFEWIYWILLSAMYPLIIVSLILALVKYLQDKKFNDAILKGVEI